MTKTEPSRFDEILAALFAAVTVAVAVFVPVLIPLPAFVIWTDLHDLSRPDNPSNGGVGCRLVEALPDQISLPQTGGLVGTTSTTVMARSVNPGDLIPQMKKQKLVIPYNQPRVDDRGIMTSAFVSIADRVPAVSITGPRSLFLDSNQSSTYGYFGAHNEDFYGGKAFVWTGDSNVTISSPNSPSTKITFQRGNARPGDQLDRTISVRVTDVEGSTATAAVVVTVFAAEPGETPSPVCKVKPWLEMYAGRMIAMEAVVRGRLRAISPRTLPLPVQRRRKGISGARAPDALLMARLQRALVDAVIFSLNSVVLSNVCTALVPALPPKVDVRDRTRHLLTVREVALS